jgi:hypothetical protein
MGQEQMTKTPTKPGENQGFEVIRDEKGRFLKGISGNPEGIGGGRPAGSISITAKIKEKLQEIPENQRLSYLDLLINKILKKAVVDGNEQMIKQIWSYVDGPPGSEQNLEAIIINLLNKNEINIQNN